MTQQAKILVLLFGLILPYVAVVTYIALIFRGNIVPLWIPAVALGYLAVAVCVFIVGKKRILSSSPSPGLAERAKQNLSGVRALRRLAYLWLIGPLFYLLHGGLKSNPAWVTALGFSLAGFLSWASSHQARKIEFKARQDSKI